jgi:uncharacterized protein (DUF58 family)
MLLKFYLSLFFGRRFYWLMVAIIILFVISFGIPFLFEIARIGFALLLLTVLADLLLLFTRNKGVTALRILPEQLSNGDQNPVLIVLANQSPFRVKVKVIDELPDQLHTRGNALFADLRPGENRELRYMVRPTQRGLYEFHKINLFFKSPLGCVVRKKAIEATRSVKVLPSYHALRHFELMAHSNKLAEGGIKKIRKIGQSLEFEQIKEYIRGDDIRSINWKATGRRGGQLMVNKFTDEKSQQIYSIIDKGRVMKMPFEGLTLLDYAINATLILSSVALAKQDKAGLITFAEQIGTFLPADHKSIQMQYILDALYAQQTQFLDSDFEKLFVLAKTRVTQRSLLVLFTNFESLAAMKRQLPYIMTLAKGHLLLLVLFENTELVHLTGKPVKDMEDLYIKTIAGKFAYEKRMMVKELQQYGVATILTSPQQLTVNLVNKYLEIKARQAI